MAKAERVAGRLGDAARRALSWPVWVLALSAAIASGDVLGDRRWTIGLTLAVLVWGFLAWGAERRLQTARREAEEALRRWRSRAEKALQVRESAAAEQAAAAKQAQDEARQAGEAAEARHAAAEQQVAEAYQRAEKRLQRQWRALYEMGQEHQDHRVQAANEETTIEARLEQAIVVGRRQGETDKDWYARKRETVQERRRLWRNRYDRYGHDLVALIEAQGGMCGDPNKTKMWAGCGCWLWALPPRSIHVDHITPQSAGGSNEWSNLQALCQPCNSSKGVRESRPGSAYGLWGSQSEIAHRVEHDIEEIGARKSEDEAWEDDQIAKLEKAARDALATLAPDGGWPEPEEGYAYSPFVHLMEWSLEERGGRFRSEYYPWALEHERGTLFGADERLVRAWLLPPDDRPDADAFADGNPEDRARWAVDHWEERITATIPPLAAFDPLELRRPYLKGWQPPTEDEKKEWLEVVRSLR